MRILIEEMAVFHTLTSSFCRRLLLMAAMAAVFPVNRRAEHQGGSSCEWKCGVGRRVLVGGAYSLI